MVKDQIKILVQFSMAAYELMREKKKEAENSLTFFRLLFSYREMQWITDAINQNAYHQAIRELRFVLESFVQAYYVDKNHMGTDIKCKMEIVKEIECLFGAKLIDGTDLKKKNELNALYGELCDYVHGTFKELSFSMPKNYEAIAKLEFIYDKEMADVCWDFVNRTIDAIFFITLSIFPEILGPNTKYKEMKNSFSNSIRELGLKLTLTKWNK
jgi:hypothetical protein